MHDSFHH